MLQLILICYQSFRFRCGYDAKSLMPCEW